MPVAARVPERVSCPFSVACNLHMIVRSHATAKPVSNKIPSTDGPGRRRSGPWRSAGEGRSASLDDERAWSCLPEAVRGGREAPGGRACRGQCTRDGQGERAQVGVEHLRTPPRYAPVSWDNAARPKPSSRSWRRSSSSARGRRPISRAASPRAPRPCASSSVSCSRLASSSNVKKTIRTSTGACRGIGSPVCSRSNTTKPPICFGSSVGRRAASYAIASKRSS